MVVQESTASSCKTRRPSRWRSRRGLLSVVRRPPHVRPQPLAPRLARPRDRGAALIGPQAARVHAGEAARGPRRRARPPLRRARARGAGGAEGAAAGHEQRARAPRVRARLLPPAARGPPLVRDVRAGDRAAAEGARDLAPRGALVAAAHPRRRRRARRRVDARPPLTTEADGARRLVALLGPSLHLTVAHAIGHNQARSAGSARSARRRRRRAAAGRRTTALPQAVGGHRRPRDGLRPEAPPPSVVVGVVDPRRHRHRRRRRRRRRRCRRRWSRDRNAGGRGGGAAAARRRAVGAFDRGRFSRCRTLGSPTRAAPAGGKKIRMLSAAERPPAERTHPRTPPHHLRVADASSSLSSSFRFVCRLAPTSKCSPCSTATGKPTAARRRARRRRRSRRLDAPRDLLLSDAAETLRAVRRTRPHTTQTPPPPPPQSPPPR